MAEFEPPEPPAGGARIEMGGQAVVEGVMMRSSKGYAIAVRKASGAIRVRKIPHPPLTRRHRAFGWPFVRGALGLFEMLIIGFRSLNYSIEEWEADFEEAERSKEARESKTPAAADDAKPAAPVNQSDAAAGAGASKRTTEAKPCRKPADRRDRSWKDKAVNAALFAASMALALVMVVAVPNLLTAGLGYLPWIRGGGGGPDDRAQSVAPAIVNEAAAADAGSSPPGTAPIEPAFADPGAGATNGAQRPSERGALVEEQRPVLYNLIAGGFRALIIFGYIWVISFFADVRRLFQYHGAEHKAVSAFEHGRPLTVSEVQPFSRLHPRCGTTFIFVVIVVSIVFFALIAWAVQAAVPHFTTWPFLGKKALIILSHLIFMPVVAGTSYELLKLSARYHRFWPAKAIVLPGFLFQRLTTREPDDDMVEVSVAALEGALTIGEAEETLEIAPSPAP
ncbi:MAG: hypothetical protein Kow0059_17110 [Candidatus Sumerlaeia bacterium]